MESFASLLCPCHRLRTPRRLAVDCPEKIYIYNYLETFAETFLKDKIKFGVEVLNIRRSPSGSWNVDIKDKHEGTITVLEYSRLVLCTGVSTRFDNVRTASEVCVFTGLPSTQCS